MCFTCKCMYVVVQINFYWFSTTYLPTFANDQIAIESQLELWVPRQVALHLDAPINGRIHHTAIGRKEDVQALQNVHKNLVLLLHSRLRCVVVCVGGKGTEVSGRVKCRIFWGMNKQERKEGHH